MQRALKKRPILVDFTTGSAWIYTCLSLIVGYWAWAAIGCSEPTVFPQGTIPGPVILTNAAAADRRQEEPGRTGTENNPLFVWTSWVTVRVGFPPLRLYLSSWGGILGSNISADDHKRCPPWFRPRTAVGHRRAEGALLWLHSDVKHTHVYHVQDLMRSSRTKSSSCEGGSGLRGGGDTAETLIR